MRKQQILQKQEEKLRRLQKDKEVVERLLSKKKYLVADSLAA